MSVGEPYRQDYVDMLPILPLRDIVVFPDMVVPLFVGRERSILAIEKALESTDKDLLMLTQKAPEEDDPKAEDLHPVGVVGHVLQYLKLPDGTVKVLVEGRMRARAMHIADNQDVFNALVETLPDEEPAYTSEFEALIRTAKEVFREYAALNKRVSPEITNAVLHLEDPVRIADLISAQLVSRLEVKQRLLEIQKVEVRLEQLVQYMEEEIDVLHTEQRIKKRVKTQMEKKQKEYYLNEQMMAIQKELGDEDPEGDETKRLEEQIKRSAMSDEAREKALGELKKMRMMNPMAAEASVIRNYIEWLLDIPWKKRSRVKHDLAVAQTVLDTDHFGLEKVKERILEYLAVQKRTKKLKGPILCLVGPPGVGKTSLARSIAEATGRKYVRMSLGGVRDEAEIRGHRRTYIGSMPGKIIQSMKKAKTSNPLFLLDEVDKMGLDYRGDPASALLEVLDPEQNHTFADHYIEVDYDLSEVMFIATANSLDLPRPLLDRMEIIRLSGYTEDEKLSIAKEHLIPKIIKHHGLKKDEWQVSDAAIRDLIRYYTREAGVRNLERELSKLARKSLKKILMPKSTVKQVKITPKQLQDYSGVRKFNFGVAEDVDQVGVVTGLAYTEVGGDLLSIEAVSIPGGKGKMTITGKLGDVMQESVQAAASYVRSRSQLYGVVPPVLQQRDIHIHVPEGATPKDGPSAGIAMCTAIVSLITGIAVKKDIAMTGEVTLRGNVLPIGGLREKLLAALRGGISTVLIPEENEKDLADIPDKVKKGLAIIPVKTVDEVLKHALVDMPSAVDWTEELDLGTYTKVSGDGELRVQ